ncbi:hypothetical protein [Deinococcus pimensis]|uniref:hypothetical protein n=1 Tax=Deinococcus pimensis TaxID=309888 RepID=UPI000487CABD|nr:hypothetical protein [Deinococcus pimensis]
MKRTTLTLLALLTTAHAQRDPVLYEHLQNLTPYRELCLAPAPDLPHPTTPRAAQTVRTAIHAALNATHLPGLDRTDATCRPGITRSRQLHLSVELTPAPTTRDKTVWPLVIRLIDPALRDAEGHAYRAVLWELRQDVTPKEPELSRALRGAFGWLRRAWTASHPR